jgi:putative oxidoreductase
MDVLLLIGRILFGALFLGSAMGHLTQTDAMAGYAGSKGVPQPKVMTIVTGLMLLAGALMVILGVWGDVGALLLVAFLIPTALIMHNFWKETDPMNKQMEMISFNKDVALAGAALVLFWLFVEVGDLPFSVTDSLF